MAKKEIVENLFRNTLGMVKGDFLKQQQRAAKKDVKDAEEEENFQNDS